MYLSDNDLTAKLPELNLVCENESHLFDPDVQIQPCSIDIRLDCIFWKTKRSIRSIDLRKSKLLEISPRRFWQMTTLNEGECIVLKPGDFVLGRTYEIFSIPNDCAGKLEGRSSMARLGLSSQIGSDFINPGWRGRMPIQLVNYSRSSIKVFPYIPICQLKLVKLTSTPHRIYGSQGLESKYLEDDGGPSYWWKDKRIRLLQIRMQERNLSLKIQEEVLGALANQDLDTIRRFEKFYDHLNPEHIENSESVLEKFIGKEKQSQRLEDFFIRGTQVIMVILTGNSLRLVFSETSISSGKIIAWIINFIVLMLFVYTFFYDKKEYYTKNKK